MASSLSEDEFNRMQIQLLELRTQNYQLDDNCKRQSRDVKSLSEKVEALEKALEKAHKTISKSKKAREVDLLIQENDALQRKLISQEEDFRLQNTTLMQELTSLVSANEDLEKKVKSSQEDGDVCLGSKDSSEVNDEIRRLQAENTAFQKNLTVQQEKYEGEQTRLKETIRLLQEINSDLENQCSKLAGRRGTPAGDENTECRTVEGQADPEVPQETLDDIPPGDDDEMITRGRNASFMELMNLVTKSESNCESLQEQVKELNALRLKLDTEIEEKKMIKEQLNTLERSSKDQIGSLQSDIEKLTEKLRKKQERVPFKIIFDGKKKAIIANCFDDLLQKACEKFNVSDGSLYLEDNTEIDDDYYGFLQPNQVLELQGKHVGDDQGPCNAEPVARDDIADSIKLEPCTSSLENGQSEEQITGCLTEEAVKSSGASTKILSEQGPAGKYNATVNQECQKLVDKNPQLLLDKGTLLKKAKTKVNETYPFKKGYSRSKFEECPSGLKTFKKHWSADTRRAEMTSTREELASIEADLKIQDRKLDTKLECYNLEEAELINQRMKDLRQRQGMLRETLRVLESKEKKAARDSKYLKRKSSSTLSVPPKRVQRDTEPSKSDTVEIDLESDNADSEQASLAGAGSQPFEVVPEANQSASPTSDEEVMKEYMSEGIRGNASKTCTRISDHLRVSQTNLTLEKYLKGRNLYCRKFHISAASDVCSKCSQILKAGHYILENQPVTLRMVSEHAYPEVKYKAFSAARKLLILPIIIIELGREESASVLVGQTQLYCCEKTPGVDYKEFYSQNLAIPSGEKGGNSGMSADTLKFLPLLASTEKDSK